MQPALDLKCKHPCCHQISRISFFFMLFVRLSAQILLTIQYIPHRFLHLEDCWSLSCQWIRDNTEAAFLWDIKKKKATSLLYLFTAKPKGNISNVSFIEEKMKKKKKAHYTFGNKFSVLFLDGFIKDISRIFGKSYRTSWFCNIKSQFSLCLQLI